jgi:thiamine-monophosphate kinase
MLDISDGLAKDANRIAKASGVQIDIDPQSLDGYRAVLDDIAQRLGKNSLDWVLFGGEDHSFLATFPKNAQIPRFFKPIGRVIEGVGVFLGPKALPDKGWDSVAG